MSVVVLLLGVRGSGKSTLLARVSDHPTVKILRPSTTRPRREGESSEYHFVSAASWRPSSMAWEMVYQDERYGLSRKELASLAAGEVGVTLFHSSLIAEISDLRVSTGIDFTTVGLDTVTNSSVQAERVGSGRVQGAEDFEQEISVVRRADVVLSGGPAIVEAALRVLVELLTCRGVLSDHDIEALLKADVLLRNGQSKSVQAASYDLSLGAEVWCKGEFRRLDEEHPFVDVPPYSYLICSAMEIANLPRFISGKFDLRVSLFFKGIILSNGPQVDPGYQGALFCLLFNASDQPVSITMGDHFATIEFWVTSRTTRGYRGEYADRDRMRHFMKGLAGGRGGSILESIRALESRSDHADERIDERMGKIETSSSQARNWLVSTTIAIAAIVIAIYIPTCARLENLEERANGAIDRMEEKVESLDTGRIDLLEERLEVLEDEREPTGEVSGDEVRPRSGASAGE